MLYFKDIDMNKLGTVYEYSGSWVKQGTYPSVEQDYESFYDREEDGPIKVVFHENSLVLIYSSRRRLFSYQHIKRIHHNKNERGEYLWIKQ